MTEQSNVNNPARWQGGDVPPPPLQSEVTIQEALDTPLRGRVRTGARAFLDLDAPKAVPARQPRAEKDNGLSL